MEGREVSTPVLSSLLAFFFPLPPHKRLSQIYRKTLCLHVESLCTMKSTFRHRHFSVIEKTVKLQNSFSLGFIKRSVNPGSRDNKNKKIRVDKTICK